MFTDVTSIDDLGNVAQDIIPLTSCTFDLGSDSRKWQNLFLCGSIDAYDGTVQAVGTDPFSITNKEYVDAQIGANNELYEVLDNGNTTGNNGILWDEVSATPVAGANQIATYAEDDSGITRFNIRGGKLAVWGTASSGAWPSMEFHVEGEQLRSAIRYISGGAEFKRLSFATDNVAGSSTERIMVAGETANTEVSMGNGFLPQSGYTLALAGNTLGAIGIAAAQNIVFNRGSANLTYLTAGPISSELQVVVDATERLRFVTGAGARAVFFNGSMVAINATPNPSLVLEVEGEEARVVFQYVSADNAAIWGTDNAAGANVGRIYIAGEQDNTEIGFGGSPVAGYTLSITSGSATNAIGIAKDKRIVFNRDDGGDSYIDASSSDMHFYNQNIQALGILSTADVIIRNGFLGIGETGPQGDLHIYGTSAPQVRIASTLGASGIDSSMFGLATALNDFISSAVAGETCIVAKAGGAMLFGTSVSGAQTEAFRILTNHDVYFMGALWGKSYIDLSEIAAPANPAANVGRFYAKDVGGAEHPFWKTSAGVETDLLGAFALTLQDVTDNGNTTTNGIIVDGPSMFNEVSILYGTLAIVTTDPLSLVNKDYVDSQIGLNNDLQEVTDNGNSTTNSITTAGLALQNSAANTIAGIIGDNLLDKTAAELVTNTWTMRTIVPQTTLTYNLGSNTQRWARAYIGPASLHIGDAGDEVVLGYGGTPGSLLIDKDVVVSGVVVGDNFVGISTDFETHVNDLAIHFTESSIDHANIQNVGTNTHGQIDSHIIDTDIHPDITGPVSITGLWSFYNIEIAYGTLTAVGTDPFSLVNKDYVDSQIGLNNDLQEITDNGNTTTNSITTAGLVLQNSATNTIAGIIGDNLLDKTAAELVTNTWTMRTILPETNLTYNLGSNTQRWGRAFIGPASLHIGVAGNEASIEYLETPGELNIDKTVNIQGDMVSDAVYASEGYIVAVPTDPTSIVNKDFLDGQVIGLETLVEGRSPKSGFDEEGVANSQFSFVGGLTRQFTIEPSGTEPSFSFWVEGIKYEKTSPQTVTITDTEGIWFFYFDADDQTLKATQVFSDDIILRHVFVSVLYWDATNNVSVYGPADERHGVVMAPTTHLYLHQIFHARWESGLALSGIVADGSGALDSHAQTGYEDGVFWDEDIQHGISADTTPASMPVWYKTGASGEWRKQVASNFPVINFVGGGGRLAYNQFTGGAWQQTEITNNQFVLAHIVATNDPAAPVVAIQGQDDYTSVAAARAGANVEINNLSLGGLPTMEFVFLATIIYQTSNSYGNTVKARIRTTDTGGDYVDWRSSQLTGSTPADHGNLSGLSDDGHAQYLLLAGRSGGQTLYAGTGPGENLVLNSTIHATKGTIRANDPIVNIGTLGVLFSEVNYSAVAGFGASLQQSRARGTEGVPVIVNADDGLGGIYAYGFDGTDFEFATQILFEVDGTPGNDDMPGRIRFLTTPDGSKTPSEVLRLSQNGCATFGGSLSSIAVGGVALTPRTVDVDELATRVTTLSMSHTATAAKGAWIFGARSRGTSSVPVIVNSGDELLRIGALGFDGTDWEYAAQILFEVATVPGSNDMPGQIRFLTTPDGSATPLEAMKIASTQHVDFSAYVRLKANQNLVLNSDDGADTIITTSATTLLFRSQGVDCFAATSTSAYTGLPFGMNNTLVAGAYAGRANNYYNNAAAKGIHDGIVIETQTGAAAGVITNMRNLIVKSPILAGAAPVNIYGIYVEAITGGSSLNYSIYTAGTAENRFGGSIRLASGRFYGPTNGDMIFESGEADGAAAIAFDMDTTNALSTSGALIWRLSNQGTAVAVVNRLGYLGLATTTPNSPLHLNGCMSVNYANSTAANVGIREVQVHYATGAVAQTFHIVGSLALTDQRIYFMRNNQQTNLVTIDPAGTDPIEGALTFALYEKNSRYLKYFDAYDATGDINISAGATDLTLDTEVTKHLSTRLYTHAADSAEITLVRAGLYRITGDCTVYCTAGTAQVEGQMWFEANPGAGFAEVAGTRRSMRSGSSAIVSGASASCTFTYTAVAGAIIKMRAQETVGANTMLTRANGVRVNIEYIDRADEAAMIQADNTTGEWKTVLTM